MDGYVEWTDFLITNIGSEGIILGLPWLKKLNPMIDWNIGRLQIPEPRVEEVNEAKLEEEGLAIYRRGARKGGTRSKIHKKCHPSEHLEP